jgi:reactive intermediate/imine deaminase
VQVVNTPLAPAPRGHYSQGVVHNGLIYVSVQLPLAPGNDPSVNPPAIEEQARQAIENLLQILAAGGGAPETLLRVTVYVSDIAHWPAVNTVYESLLGEARPARGVVPCGKLHLGYDVAIDAVAAVADGCAQRGIQAIE